MGIRIINWLNSGEDLKPTADKSLEERLAGVQLPQEMQFYVEDEISHRFRKISVISLYDMCMLINALNCKEDETCAHILDVMILDWDNFFKTCYLKTPESEGTQQIIYFRKEDHYQFMKQKGDYNLLWLDVFAVDVLIKSRCRISQEDADRLEEAIFPTNG